MRERSFFCDGCHRTTPHTGADRLSYDADHYFIEWFCSTPGCDHMKEEKIAGSSKSKLQPLPLGKNSDLRLLFDPWK